MSLWGNLDAANNAPKQSAMTGYGGNTPQVTANAQVYYANTQVGAFIAGEAIGVFGIDASEQALLPAANLGKPQHAGWVVRKVGSGPVGSITANSGVYGTNAAVTFTGGGGGSAANAYAYFDGTTGALLRIQLNNGGSNYTSTPTATIAGANASLTVVMGGRAGRVLTETLVAMGSMRGDGDTLY
jgi:hypothetical protein